MMSIDWLMESACNFPIKLRFSGSSEQAVKNGFARAAIECGNASGYLSFSLFASLAAGAVLGAVSFLLFSDVILSAGISIFSFGILFLFLLKLPLLLAFRREKIMEARLP